MTMTPNDVPPSPPNADRTTGACEVTGKLVPIDELIEFQGMRVCAEGKAVLVQRLRDGDPLDANTLRRPSNWIRMVAWMLDGSVLSVVNVVITLIVLMPLRGELVQAVENSHSAGALIDNLVYLVKQHQGRLLTASALVAVLNYAYYVLLHRWRGQTVGKIAMGLRLVGPDGGKPPLSAILLREAFHVGLVLLITVAALLVFILGLGSPAETGLQMANWLYWLYLLVSGIVLLTDEFAQRAIHDRLAGTRIVRLS